MLKPGSPAPHFSATDHNGNRVSLSDFTGKTVILWFYPKADTPG
jgi:peroxiredoxin Q/BCP